MIVLRLFMTQLPNYALKGVTRESIEVSITQDGRWFRLEGVDFKI